VPIASTSFDLVVGLDTHVELVPTPVPTPTPFPHPHCSVLWDPLGPLVAEVTGMLLPSAPSAGGPVHIGGRAASVAGHTARMIVSHVVIPPGTAFATGVTPSDAELRVGSESVLVRGRSAVRAGEVAMSCSEPARLPSSQVVSTAASPNVTMIGGPPAPATDGTPDILDARPPRKQWTPSAERALLAKVWPLEWERLRRLMPKDACFFTGHPVNIATGTVSTEACDVELHGALPLRFAREYDSNWAARDSPLGFGWSHCLDQRVWLERGRVVVLLGDGRELEFATAEFADQAMRRGDTLWHPVDRLTLHAKGELEWELHGVDGTVRLFAPIAGERAADAARGMSRLVAVRRHGRDALVFHYDEHARLERVDGGARLLQLQYDEHGHVRRLLAPSGNGDELAVHAEFEYADGDLVAVKDALGHAWRFDYDGHLLVREQDRNGLGFYFHYDGRGPRGRCIRTWGDGGIYDHVITYDPRGRTTIVTNSLGEVTTYAMNALGLVVGIAQPDGTTKAREYADTTWLVAEIDELGHATRYSHDARGNLVAIVQPDGSTTTARYEHDRIVERIDATGARWRFTYDRLGRLHSQVDPLGHTTTNLYEGGALQAIIAPDGTRTSFTWDRADNLVGRTTSDGRTTTWTRDACGRIVARTSSGAVVRYAHDPAGRVIAVLEPDGGSWQIERDAEGNPVRIAGPTLEVRLRYVGRRWLAAQETGGSIVGFRYDTEGQRLAVVDEAGRPHTFERAPAGHVHAEVAIDGKRTLYLRDAAGRLAAMLLPDGTKSSLERDAVGRCTSVTAPGGARAHYAYDALGRLTEARNEHACVRFEYDALGRVIEERCERFGSGREVVVSCRWDHLGQRVGVRSSLGADLAFEHDVAGDIVGIEQRPGTMHGWTAQLRYDEEGHELERILPGGARSIWGRDAIGPLRHAIIDADRRLVRERVYRWTPGGRLRGLAEDGQTEDVYEFDRRGALTHVVLRDGDVLGRFPDPVGRLFSSPDRTDRDYGSAGELLRSRSAVDDVRFEYDARGRLIRKHTKDGTWRFQWDGFDRLERVDRPSCAAVSMTYDALGRRLSKVHAGKRTDFAWDGDVLLHEWTDEDVITWVFEPGCFAPLARITSGDVHSVIADHVGTPLAVLDGHGRCSAVLVVDVFGRVEVVGNAALCPFRFAGQYADTEFELHYNRHRYYDPSTGVYTSRDPLGVRAGLRPYAYVDDPTTWSDPLGLAAAMGAGQSCSGGTAALDLLSAARSDLRSDTPARVLAGQLSRPDLLARRLGRERTDLRPGVAAFLSLPAMPGAPFGLDRSPFGSRW
jgi:RHS repeat-associated protein